MNLGVACGALARVTLFREFQTKSQRRSISVNRMFL